MRLQAIHLGLLLLMVLVLAVNVGSCWMRHTNITTFVNSGVQDACLYDQQDTPCTSSNRVVMYYAPWCTFCDTLRPEFVKAASRAAASGLDVCFMTVNSDAQGRGNTCIKIKGASALPTIQLETAGSVFPHKVYNGLRNASDIFSWVHASLGST